MIEKLIPLKFEPGFYRNGTKYEAKGRWFNGNLVRFYEGAIRPVQGWRVAFDPNNNPMVPLAGIPRAAFGWRSVTGAVEVAVGTTKALYILKDGVAFDITPVDFTGGGTDGGNDVFATGLLTSDGTNVLVDETVTLGPVTYTFKASVTTIANEVKIGATAAESLTNLKAAVNNLGGGNYGSLTVVNPSVFADALTATTLAFRARIAGSTGNTLATTETSAHLSFGAATLLGGSGGNGDYGNDPYGSGLYGIGRAPLAAQLNDADSWQLDAFGDALVAVSTNGGRIYVWAGDTAARALVATGSPEPNRAAVITPERFLMALGAEGDVRKVMWASQNSVTDWVPTAQNTAGDFTLTTQGRIMCGRRTPAQTLIFTDTDLHSANYIGGEFVYSFKQEGDKCGIISPQAVAIVDTSAIWMGRDAFYGYDGFVRPIPSSVSDYVFDDFNAQQSSKVFAVPVSEFGEVWFFYPSSGSSENDRYVVYNYREKHWTTGTLARTAAIDRGALPTPVMFDALGTIYTHELSAGGDRLVPPALVFSDALDGVLDQTLQAYSANFVKISGSDLVFDATDRLIKNASTPPIYKHTQVMTTPNYEVTASLRLDTTAGDDVVAVGARLAGDSPAGYYFGLRSSTSSYVLFGLTAAGADLFRTEFPIPAGLLTTNIRVGIRVVEGVVYGLANGIIIGSQADPTYASAGFAGLWGGGNPDTINLSDAMTDTDGTTIPAHTGGLTWVKIFGTGDMTIQSNAAEENNVGLTSDYRASEDPGVADYKVSADFGNKSATNAASQMWLIARGNLVDRVAYALRILYSTTDTTFQLVKVDAGGGLTNITNPYSSGINAASTPFSAAIEVSGTTLTAEVNGVVQLTGTDATISAGGRGGFYSNGGSSFSRQARIDNFRISNGASDLFLLGPLTVYDSDVTRLVDEGSATVDPVTGALTLVPFLESGPIELGDGDNVFKVQRIVPDEKNLGDVKAKFFTSLFPTEVEVERGPFTLANPTAVRFTARQIRLRLEEVRDTNWRIGITRLGIILGGRR